MRKTAAIVLMFTFAAVSASAQTVINGSITDLGGKPVSNISIMVHEAGNAAILAYSFSDTDGYYEITVISHADSLDVKTNSIFHKKEIVRVANNSQSIDFVLKDEVQELEGVTVTARPIEQRGDTLEYFVGSFVQKEDKSIEDVLKRMPGIEVTNNGQIIYQGAPIHKFYVEGMDLMDGRYVTVSHNLPHQSVASVEIYENHQPIRILKDKVSSEQASLNIRLSKNVAATGSGRVGIGVAPFLWDISLTPMLFSSKMQMVVSYQTDNTGNDLMMFTKQMTYEQLSNDRPTKNEGELSIRQPNPPILDQRRYLDNTSHLANFNILFPMGNTMQMRANVYYLNDLQRQSAEQKTTLYLPCDTTSYTERLDNKLYDQQIFGTVTFDRNDKSFYLNDKIDFSGKWQSSLGHLLNNENVINQDLDQNPQCFSNDLRIIFPAGKHLFDFVSFNSYGVTPEILEIEPGVFPDLLNDSISYSKTRQELDKKQLYTDESFSGIFTFGKISMSAKAGFKYLKKNVNSRLSQFGNDVTHSFAKPYLRTDFEYKIKRITLTLNFPLSLNIAEIDSKTSGNQSIEKLFFSPSLSFKMVAGDFWTFYLSGRFEQSIDNFDHYYENFILKDYNSLVVEFAPLSVSYKTNGKARIVYKQPFISLNASLSYSYQYRKSEMTCKYFVDRNGASVLEMVEQPNNSDYHIVHASVKKFFSKIRTTLGLKGSLAFLKSHTILNESFMATSSVSTSLSPDVMIKITEWLHLDYSLNWNVIVSKTDGEERNRVNYLRHNCDLLMFPGRDHLVCLTSEIYDYQQETCLYMDISYQYSLRKLKLDFELKLSNIFNSDAYVSYYTGDFSLMESVYKLRQREIFASVKFRF